MIGPLLTAGESAAPSNSPCSRRLGGKVESFTSGKKRIVVDRAPLLPHLSGRYPELDLRRAKTQVALTLEPGVLGKAVPSEQAGRALGKPEAPAPGAGVSLSLRLSAL